MGSRLLAKRIGNSKALLRRPLGSAPPGTLQRPRRAQGVSCGAAAPVGASRRQGWRGAALLPLGLDTPRRMG